MAPSKWAARVSELVTDGPVLPLCFIYSQTFNKEFGSALKQGQNVAATAADLREYDVKLAELRVRALH
jgi:hypothetical protein